MELDQFIGERFLVTVHGPMNPAADPAAARVEVDIVRKRLVSGKLHPEHGYQLAYALVSALAGRLRTFLADLTAEVWSLEYCFQASVQERNGLMRDAEQFLDELFRTRHGLMAAKTIAGQSRDVFARMYKIKAFGPGAGRSGWTTPSTSSTGCGRWPRVRRTPCRERSSSTRRGPTPR